MIKAECYPNLKAIANIQYYKTPINTEIPTLNVINYQSFTCHSQNCHFHQLIVSKATNAQAITSPISHKVHAGDCKWLQHTKKKKKEQNSTVKLPDPEAQARTTEPRTASMMNHI